MLKLPGALSVAGSDGVSEELEKHVTATLEQAIERLNHMREEEGHSAAAELRERMQHLSKATLEVESLRHKVLKAYHDKVHGRMQELIGAHADADRILQEAAMLAERSDIQEELVRMKNHIQHFLSHIDAGGEVGKKLDFLLQEMNREANTLLSKTTGVAGEALAHHRAGAGHEVGDRTSQGAGAEPRMNEIVFIISAPSGSGKSTLTAELRRIVPNLEFSISYTTRQPRGSEQNGREYFFVSREEFERMIGEDQFLEFAEVFGNYYGTARSFLREAFARGNDLILDIDVQGAAQVKRKLPDAVSIFILPPSREELERRLRRRTLAENEMRRQLTGVGKSEEELEAIVQRRLQEASREIENYSQYDYILVNEKVEAAIDVLQAIVKSERLKHSPQPPRAVDEQVMATAEMAERANMIGKVQAILATFAVSSSQTTSHTTTE